MVTNREDPMIIRVAETIMGFDWDSYRLDEVGQIKPEFADYAWDLAAEIVDELKGELVWYLAKEAEGGYPVERLRPRTKKGDMMTCLRVGDMVHGHLGGMFGRDHYDCARIEAIGADWAIIRTVDGDVRSACGMGIHGTLVRYRDVNSEYPHSTGCPSYGLGG